MMYCLVLPLTLIDFVPDDKGFLLQPGELFVPPLGTGIVEVAVVVVVTTGGC